MNPNLLALDFEPTPMCEGRSTCIRPAVVYAQRSCCIGINTLCLECVRVFQRLTFQAAVNIRCNGCGATTPSSSGITILGPIKKEASK